MYNLCHKLYKRSKKFTGGNERYLCSFFSFVTHVTSYLFPIISKSSAKLATRLRVVVKLYGATLNKKIFCLVTHSEILHKDCVVFCKCFF